MFNVNINTLHALCSLRSDIRTDSLVDMIKKQQSKTTELAQIYREQKQED